MNGEQAIIRLYIKPEYRYWAYTPLLNGGFLVIFGYLGWEPTFKVTKSAAVADKIEKGYELHGDIMISNLCHHAWPDTSSRKAIDFFRKVIVKTAADYEVCSGAWIWSPEFRLQEVETPKSVRRVMPDIVIDDSANRYTW